MPISDVVNVSISISAAGPTRASFGVPLIAACNLPVGFSGTTNTYNQLTDLVAVGFTVSHPVYLCAAELKAQTPSVPSFKVGKRATSTFTQTLEFVCVTYATGIVYSFSIAGKPVTYTVPGSSSADSVATALASAISALSISGATVTTPGSAATVKIVMTAGLMIDFKPDLNNMTFSDATTFTSTNLATDLTAIQAADQNWYGLLLDSNSSAEILEAAAWAESNGPVLFGTNNSDSAIATSSSGDVASSMKTASYARSFGLFSQTQLLSYSAAAWMGYCFTFAPGSVNWSFKTLAGVRPDNLSSTQYNYVTGKNWSVYTALMGLNLTQGGITPSGHYIDTTQSSDYLVNTIQATVLGILANAPKVPFTDGGIDNLVAGITGVLTAATQPPLNILSNNPAPVVTAPAAASVDPTDKSNRNLPNVTFSGTLQGAIDSIQISGNLVQ